MRTDLMAPILCAAFAMACAPPSADGGRAVTCAHHQPADGWSETQIDAEGEPYVIAPDGTRHLEFDGRCCVGRREQICVR